MIQVNGLDKAYGQQVVFDNAGFTINPGERVGLVGRNGHGKTTLLKMITGEELHDAGVISIPNGYLIGHLTQHIRFTGHSVLEEGCLSLQAAEDGSDETYRVSSILLGLGFSPEDFDRSPSDLSGGFQVRLKLAKVLVSVPNLLLLDEPTNYLDIVSIRWLTQFLRSWKNEMILVTHDRTFMDSVTTHTMCIHRCRIRKIAGPSEKLYQQILQEEEVYEQTRINDEKKRIETLQFINRFRAQANKARAVQSRIKALQKHAHLEQLAEIKNLDFAFRAASFSGKQLLRTENISFSFTRSGRPLIDGLTFSIGKRDRIAIVGKNGRGKTTLLNLLAGEITPQEGAVIPHPDLKTGYFGQTNINRLNPRKTVEEEILDIHPEHNRGAARKICGLMMFEGDSALKKIDVLSGGERSRVLIGKLLVSPSNLLLLDEPTNHLDMESIDSLLEAIEEFEGAVVIVTHSEMILHAVASRLIVFDDGKVTIFEGTYQDFLDRVGWKDEDLSRSGRDQNMPLQEKAVTKKELRRSRAEIITDRSKTLLPLQSRIAEVEEIIMRTEKEIEEDTGSLVEASMKGDGESIKRISKSLHTAKERIEVLFSELAALTEEYDEKEREFENRLNCLRTGT